ncbi:MAG: dethiobiotin synthase [Candidatus Omnitrophica bacterium]|nr:dethiobiotin synthase [Candidatus Omnitrophota bacterium]
MDKKAVFITGTDTGVGKTLVTGMLGRFMSENGFRTITQKWIQTGSRGHAGDIAVHLELMRITEKDIEKYLPHVAPCVFSFPGSPHLAARLEQRTVDAGKILDSFYLLKDDFDFVVVEGAGGPMVPIDNRTMMIDICDRAGIPALIVAGNRLGAINQTVLTIEALKKRGIDVPGIVFNRTSPREDELVLRDNPVIVNELTGVAVFGSLPYNENPDALYQLFRPMGRAILNKMRQGDTDG